MDKENFDKYLDDSDDLNEAFEEEEEYDDDEHSNKSGGKTFTRGFLTALAICIVAIGAAVWTTVSNVNTYLNPQVDTKSENSQDSADNDANSSDNSLSSIFPAEAQVAATVSGIKVQSSVPEEDSVVSFVSLPINSEIIQDYSETPVYNKTLKDYRAHPAIDYKASIDDKVKCMGNGTVCDIYYDEMLGNTVVIEHSDSIKSYYCGLAKTALVQVGDKVSGGDFIGTVYSTPCETAEKPHVHIAVTENGKWKNPQDYFKAD